MKYIATILLVLMTLAFVVCGHSVESHPAHQVDGYLIAFLFLYGRCRSVICIHCFSFLCYMICLSSIPFHVCSCAVRACTHGSWIHILKP